MTDRIDWSEVHPCEWPDGCKHPAEIVSLENKWLCNRHLIQDRERLNLKGAPEKTRENRIRVGFVNPRGKEVWENLAGGYIKAWCDQPFDIDGKPRSDKLDAQWHFADRYYDSFDETVQMLSECDYGLFSCCSNQYGDALRLVRAARELNPSLKTIVGGAHPTSDPVRVAKDSEWDWIVLREGEEAALLILQENIGPWCQRSPISPKIIETDFLSVPQLEAVMPDRVFIKQYRNIQTASEENDGQRICSIFSSRGCGHSCSFCSSKLVWSRRTRYRSPTNIIKEIEHLVDTLGCTYLKFSDDLIASNVRRIKEFAYLKATHPDERIRNLPWGGNHRVNTGDDEMFELFNASNCDMLWIGLETGSEQQIHNMRKAQTLERVAWTFEMCRRHNIKSRSYILIGSYGESPETIRETIEFVTRVHPDVVGTTILMPFPGTLEYNLPVPHDRTDNGEHSMDCDTCRNHPHITDGMTFGEAITDWDDADEYGNDYMRTEHLTNRQLRIAQRYMLEQFAKFANYSARTLRQLVPDDEYDPGFLEVVEV